MKIRNGFVSNSSSSSFVISAQRGKDLKTQITFDIDLKSFVDDEVSSVSELDNFYESEYGDPDYKDRPEYKKAKSEIEKGNVVYFGRFADDNEPIETLLCEMGLKGRVNKKITVIRSEGGY
jgi:hypothetical protein